ncbi:MAG: hypothetical protein ACYTDE_11205, partial [Planctomycetota bacterium]
MIDAVEDVPEPERDEPERGLMPARIQTDQSGVARELEGSLRTAGWQEAEHRDRADSQVLEV